MSNIFHSLFESVCRFSKLRERLSRTRSWIHCHLQIEISALLLLCQKDLATMNEGGCDTINKFANFHSLFGILVWQTFETQLDLVTHFLTPKSQETLTASGLVGTYPCVNPVLSQLQFCCTPKLTTRSYRTRACVKFFSLFFPMRLTTALVYVSPLRGDYTSALDASGSSRLTVVLGTSRLDRIVDEAGIRKLDFGFEGFWVVEANGLMQADRRSLFVDVFLSAKAIEAIDDVAIFKQNAGFDESWAADGRECTQAHRRNLSSDGLLSASSLEDLPLSRNQNWASSATHINSTNSFPEYRLFLQKPLAFSGGFLSTLRVNNR